MWRDAGDERELSANPNRALTWTAWQVESGPKSVCPESADALFEFGKQRSFAVQARRTAGWRSHREDRAAEHSRRGLPSMCELLQRRSDGRATSSYTAPIPGSRQSAAAVPTLQCRYAT